MRLEEAYLPTQFQEFYRELVSCKRAVEKHVDSQEDEPDSVDAGENMVSRVHSSLLSILEQQAVESGKRGGEYGAGYYREAQYVMAALADDVFLNMEWPGRETWKTNLLEFRLFGSHSAGEQFYVRLDKLLKERDTAYVGMAAVFFLSLSMGFLGKYRGRSDSGQLTQYKQQLFSFIFQEKPALNEEKAQLFPQTHAYTLDKGEGLKLAQPRRWFWLAASIILVFLVSSHFVWNHYTSEFYSVLNDFLTVKGAH